jgi:hypothetical protein
MRSWIVILSVVALGPGAGVAGGGCGSSTTGSGREAGSDVASGLGGATETGGILASGGAQAGGATALGTGGGGAGGGDAATGGMVGPGTGGQVVPGTGGGLVGGAGGAGGLAAGGSGGSTGEDAGVDGPTDGLGSVDALKCTAAQEDLRATVYQNTIIPYADIPEVPRDFVAAFLSQSYVEEHFRFFPYPSSFSANPYFLYFYFIDGCYTDSVPGQIQWNVPMYQGKIRYLGPSREWRILVGEEQARAAVEAAGCDASNLDLEWAAEGTPIPGVDEYSGMSHHPIWRAGGQSVPVPPDLPAESHCYGPVCQVHAETGAVLQTPRSCASPG